MLTLADTVGAVLASEGVLEDTTEGAPNNAIEEMIVGTTEGGIDATTEGALEGVAERSVAAIVERALSVGDTGIGDLGGVISRRSVS